MAKVLGVNGRLAGRGGKVVSDAGGAPCCCGGCQWYTVPNNCLPQNTCVNWAGPFIWYQDVQGPPQFMAIVANLTIPVTLTNPGVYTGTIDLLANPALGTVSVASSLPAPQQVTVTATLSQTQCSPCPNMRWVFSIDITVCDAVGCGGEYNLFATIGGSKTTLIPVPTPLPTPPNCPINVETYWPTGAYTTWDHSVNVVTQACFCAPGQSVCQQLSLGPATVGDCGVVPVGGCCLPNNSCQNMTQQECANANGVWTPNQLCTGSLCPPDPPILGACCLEDGTCIDMTQVACAAANGAWNGPGSTCILTHCPQPPPPDLGACCFNGVCVEGVGQQACVDAGGVPLGVGTTCNGPIECPPLRVAGQSWNTSMPSRGFGDTLKKVFTKTGIVRVVGECKKCNDRQDWTNKVFPYRG